MKKVCIHITRLSRKFWGIQSVSDYRKFLLNAKRSQLHTAIKENEVRQDEI